MFNEIDAQLYYGISSKKKFKQVHIQQQQLKQQLKQKKHTS